MNVYESALQRRTIRRFTQKPVPREALEKIVEAARLSPTAVNRQPLRFAVIPNPALCRRMFPLTAWARRIPDGSAGPTEDTQPTAYIAILYDRETTEQPDTDAGAAAMSILLTAKSLGIASCWIMSVNRKEALALLGIDETRYGMHSIIALGHPAMEAKAVPMMDDKTDYYLESADMLCVPKRAAEDASQWFE